MEITQMASMLGHNTFHIDCSARYYAEYASVGELREVLRWRHEHAPELPLLPIGEGSNLLFTTPVYEGFVIKAKRQSAANSMLADAGRVTVWAGVVMDEFIQWAIEHHLHGLENLSWIPGTVGASAVQNIGAYGCEAGAYIDHVQCLDSETLEERTFTHDECLYAYRDSIFKHERQWIVTYVTYRLQRHFEANLQYGNLAEQFAGCTPTPSEVRRAIIDTRIAKLPDPAKEGNAGSFFMNPVVSREVCHSLLSQYNRVPHYPAAEGNVKLSAAWLIEQVGWKGRSLGPATVSDRHSLILINRGGATGQDIVQLCRAIQDSVRNQFGIDIHPEVNFL